MSWLGSPRRAAVATGAAGAVVTVTVSLNAAMSAGEAVKLVSIAAGSAAAGGFAGWGVVRALRGRRLAWQISALACSATLGVMVGAWAGARAMFLSSHDLAVLQVLLVASASVSCAVGLLLGAEVGRSGDALVEATRRLGRGEPLPPSGAHAAAELDRLARELERTSTRLAESSRRERQLEESRRELIAWISHDLRTPLAGIRAIAEALEDRVASDPETVARYHSMLREQSEQLAELVDDLFELSRAETAVVQLELQRISLADLVSDALSGVAPVADAKGVQIEGRVVGDVPELSVSPPEVLRALRNILENAVRHTPADGSITVEAGRDAAGAYVSVTDRGGGIAAADLPRIFDAGYRGDPARTPGEGAGLGLAIARGLVEAHRGEILVANDNGGARFVVRLPVPEVGE